MGFFEDLISDFQSDFTDLGRSIFPWSNLGEPGGLPINPLTLILPGLAGMAGILNKQQVTDWMTLLPLITGPPTSQIEPWVDPSTIPLDPSMLGSLRQLAGPATGIEFAGLEGLMSGTPEDWRGPMLASLEQTALRNVENRRAFNRWREAGNQAYSIAGRAVSRGGGMLGAGVTSDGTQA